MTRINNELANATPELAKKNALPEAAKQIEVECALLSQSNAYGAAIAHMMNNIMMKILGATEVIAMKSVPELDSQRNIW